MLDANAGAPLSAFVVWEPVIATDFGPPTSAALRLIHDGRAIQYWDAKRALSRDIVRAVRAHPSRYSPPREIAEDLVVWDFVALFPKGVRWDQDLPVPTHYGGPVVETIAETKEQLAREFSFRDSNRNSGDHGR